MSLTRPVQSLSSNPARHFIKAKCGFDPDIELEKNGYFEYFVKDPSGKKDSKGKTLGENFRLSFNKDSKGFMLIDENLMTITGWNNEEGYSLISNEVRAIDEEGNIGTGILTVVKHQGGKKTTVAVGTYEQVKPIVIGKKTMEGNYTRSLYIMLPDLQMDNLHLSGTAYAAWLEFLNKHKSEIHKYWIHIKEWTKEKNGGITFMKPHFAFGPEVTPDELAAASNLDIMLQEYLDGYEKRTQKNSDPSKVGKTEDAAPQEEQYDVKTKWRDFDKHEGGVPVGSMSIDELYRWQADLVKSGETDTLLYDCISMGVFEFETTIKKGTWKDVETKDGRKFGSLSLTELKAGLTTVNKADPKNYKKLYLEAGIKVLTDEEAAKNPPAKDGDFEVVDDAPF